MAVTLAQAAQLSNDALQRGVLEVFVQESVIFDRLPLLEIEGNSYRYNEEGTLPGVAFRSVNEAYVESTGTVNQKSEGLVILGGDADVDRFIVQTRGNLNDQRATQTAMKVKAANMTFTDAFFNGDVSVNPKGFDGLKKRLTGTQVIDAATNGLPIIGNGGTDAQAFFDQLDGLIASVAGNVDALYLPKALRAKVMGAGRRLGGMDWVNASFADGAVVKRIPTYNGVPMLDPGVRSDGSPILTVAETQGTAVDAGSIYAVSFGQSEADQAVTGLSNGGVSVRDLGEVPDKPAYRTRIEFYCGLGVFGGKAAARLRGVRNA